jgi:septal ring factor EnvC (AmiA/AmiB activator)
VKLRSNFLSAYLKSMKFNKAFLYLLFSLVLAYPGFCQDKTKEELRKEKATNIEQIKLSEATLQATSQKKKASLGELNALKYQIRVRERIIRNIRAENRLLAQDIEENEQIIEALESDILELKEEYSAMTYAAYKASNSRDRLTFLFSASSFNQFLRRLEYLEQYSASRQKQAGQINEVVEVLASENISIKTKQEEQVELLEERLQEAKSLQNLKVKENKVVASLETQEKELRKDLKKRRNSLAALDKMIDNVIKKEMAAEKAATTATIESSIALSKDFAQNKNKLPWPVNGFISQKFGKSRDPILRNVERNSPGIDIQTTPDEIAHSVFPGEVTAVAAIPGFNRAVIVQHGEYRTVYAKLDKVMVTKGQKINVGDSIGEIYTDGDGIAELHFQLWKVGTKLNPEQWLSER